MRAYLFQAQFAAPIIARTKRQTIRSHRKRHALPGEVMQLYTGMRTEHCRAIGRADCQSVGLIRIDLAFDRVEFGTGTAITTVPDLDHFATTDGFHDWQAMAAFFRKIYPNDPVFSGVLIRWGGTFRPEVVEAGQ